MSGKFTKLPVNTALGLLVFGHAGDGNVHIHPMVKYENGRMVPVNVEEIKDKLWKGQAGTVPGCSQARRSYLKVLGGIGSYKKNYFLLTMEAGRLN